MKLFFGFPSLRGNTILKCQQLIKLNVDHDADYIQFNNPKTRTKKCDVKAYEPFTKYHP